MVFIFFSKPFSVFNISVIDMYYFENNEKVMSGLKE